MNEISCKIENEQYNGISTQE